MRFCLGFAVECHRCTCTWGTPRLLKVMRQSRLQPNLPFGSLTFCHILQEFPKSDEWLKHEITLVELVRKRWSCITLGGTLGPLGFIMMLRSQHSVPLGNGLVLKRYYCTCSRLGIAWSLGDVDGLKKWLLLLAGSLGAYH